MNHRNTFCVLALFVLASARAFAGPVTINFVSSLLTAQRGQTATFSASLINTSGEQVFLNSDSLNIAAPLIGDDLKFFLNTPVALGPGASFPAVEIFDITVPLAAPLGLYGGNFDILGGPGPASFSTVGSATFAVQVVPEPATGLMLFAALAAIFIRRRRE
jgi:hypothetical protein